MHHFCKIKRIATFTYTNIYNSIGVACFCESIELETIQERVSKISQHGGCFLILSVTLPQVLHKLVKIVVLGVALGTYVVDMVHVDDVTT